MSLEVTPGPAISPVAFPSPDFGTTPQAFFTTVYNWVFPEFLSVTAATVGVFLFALLIRKLSGSR